MFNFIRENWWYLLLLGGIAFFMIRGGGCCGVGHSHNNRDEEDGGCCGGGHSHGGQNVEHSVQPSQYEGNNINQSNLVRDPICGMVVDPNSAIRETINGRVYYFCSDSCRKELLRRQQNSNLGTY
ncbi:MAG: hypothetical protein ABF904_14180 [Ethanoligenens sp.]